MSDRPYLAFLDVVTARDLEVLRQKDAEYGGSWLKRGGVGAFMMLARKWDRLEEQVKLERYDVFAAVALDHREEGLLDDIADLRRYLILVEAEIIRQRGGRGQEKK